MQDARRSMSSEMHQHLLSGRGCYFCCLLWLCRLVGRKNPQIPPPTDHFYGITEKLSTASEYLEPTPRPQDAVLTS